MIVSLQGIAISILVQSWSVMVKIESCPADSGSFTIKSIAIVWNGNAPVVGVIGFKGAFRGCMLTLFCWHWVHPLTYSCTSFVTSEPDASLDVSWWL